MNSSTNIYFSGLNGLRFLAAMAVVITHIELIKGQMFFENLWSTNKLVFELGGLGVVFFFVLSGFLITYLLLEEKKVSNTISVKKFYLRRILRIWPLYYLVIVLGFFVLPHVSFIDIPFLTRHLNNGFWSNFSLYMLLLPNLAFAFFGAVPHVGQTWSIGVEEQFYILWPWLIKYSKNVLRTLLIFMIGFILLKIVVLFLVRTFPGNEFLLVVKPFLAMTKMESMAIGGMGAYLLFNKMYIQRLYNNMILLSAIVFCVVLIYFTPAFIQDGIHLVYSVLFLVIIINVSSNPNSFLKLEGRIFKTLGNISYGIYMYHMIVIAVVVGVLNKMEFKVDNGILSQLTVYSLSTLLTIFLSWISYNFFEKAFLKLKIKHTVVKSGSFE